MEFSDFNKFVIVRLLWFHTQLWLAFCFTQWCDSLRQNC